MLWQRQPSMLRRGAWFSVAVAIVATGCAQPTSPTPDSPPAEPSGPALTVSGTVFVRAVDGVSRFANGALSGWVQSGGSGRATGAILVDAKGSYRVTVSAGARLHLFTADDFFQPCAASRTVTADTTLDVTLVADPGLVGGRLPADVVAGTRTLSGTVYEIDPDGQHRPIEDAGITFDGAAGLGVPFASTATDANGFYVLCGLDDETSGFLYVTKNAFKLGEASTAIVGTTTLDIEMTRR